MNTYEKDLNSLKHLIASSGNFNQYVSSLDVFKKREFINDVEYIISKTKNKYNRFLKYNLIIFAFFAVSFLNMKFNYSILSIIIFISTFGVLFTSTLEVYKNWKTVRQYKMIKKAIKTSWLGEAEIEDDDLEFLMKGKKCTIN